MPASIAPSRKKSAPLSASAAALALSCALGLTAVTPAFADTGKHDADKPPAKMSTVGGELLGRPGTQVRLAAGAPALPKKLSAKSWIVSDAESGDVLAAHNAHWQLPPASTLKMLFADTVLPKFPRTTTHKVVPSDLAGMGAGSSKVGIKEGYTYTVHDLWLGVFLRSGNDAVHVLSAMNDGVAETVKEMQAHAEELRADDTHVVSPDGYDMPGQHSSAYDLSLFARSGLQKKDFREYCSTPRAEFPKKQKEGKTTERFQIQNTDKLLTGYPGLPAYQGLAGVKNGYTSHAGNTYTGVAERDGKVLLVTVMAPKPDESHAVYREAARLLDWGFRADGKVTPVGHLVPPRGADPSASASDGAAKSTPNPARGAAQASAADDGDRSGGIGIALGITGGVLALVAGAVFVVRRKWPLEARGPKS
ncbi:D-alanyl-D-alanine carboxypeptidase family protein [Streptomyces beihaiensis]|uniref:D-alanyl-D-alanine carboxypeptidase family protein n=1 Tax=Streptomyces beihaiensis TaxID=2984495 RepID=UPI002B1CCE2B|nr:D-alanyl-D-alanine carboxypeptidase [Streptomyces beihaiensis]